MSYLVLARRWRPMKFSEVVGQPHVVRTLLNSIRQKRLAHAYVFSGPRGIGKTTVARLLARTVNCLQPAEGEPCGVCRCCEGIAAGSFIDVMEIDAASNTGVDDVRKLRDGIRYTPIEGRAKVYIIDEVHMLSAGAFNALLKTLEEPPEHAYFCLATTEVHKIPSTILSRCQRFDFRRVPVSEIRAHLIHICQTENIPFDEEGIDLIARRAEGSIRDSLSLLDQVIAFAEGAVQRREAADIVGEIPYDNYFRAIELVRSGSAAEAFDLEQNLSFVGADAQDFVGGLQACLLQILQIKSQGVQQVDIPREAVPQYQEAAGWLGEGDIIRLLQMCAAAEVDLRRNYHPRTRLQLLLLRLAAFERSVLLNEVLNHLEKSPAAATPPPRRPDNPPPRAKVRKESQTDRTLEDTSPPQESDEISSPLTPASSRTPATAAAESIASSMPNPLQAAQSAWAEICDRLSGEFNSSARMIKYGGAPVSFINGKLRLQFSSAAVKEAAVVCHTGIKRELNALIPGVRLELAVGPLPESMNAPVKEDIDPNEQLLVDRLGARRVNSVQ